MCTAKGLSLCDEPTENYNIIVRALSSFKCPLANIVFSHSCFHRLSPSAPALLNIEDTLFC